MHQRVTELRRICLLVGLCQALLATGAVAAPPGAPAAPADSPWLEIPLIDQNGRPTRLADHRGQVVLLSFVFTSCPGPCPALTARLVEVQRRMGDDLRGRVHFVSVGIDPDDGIDDLAAFAQARGVRFDAWSFVSGEPEEVAKLAGLFSSGLFAARDGQPDHRLAVFMLDPDGRSLQRYAAASLDVDRLLEDLRRVARRAQPEPAD